MCYTTPAAMSNIQTEGQGNVPEQPVLVLPNRLNAAALQALETALGGPSRVAWLVEDSLRPSAEIMGHLSSTRAAGILCSIDRQSREMISENIHDKLATGRHVVLLTGSPAALPATVSGVPGRLLSFFDNTTLPALPVYVGGYNNSLTGALADIDHAEDTEMRFLPLQRAGAGLGTRVLAAWMEAAADQLAKHPALQQETLPQALLRSLTAHPKTRLTDGVDDTTLTFRELLALALMFVKILRKHTQHKRIGVLLPPGKSSFITNVACVLAGIVPVNFNYNLNEKEFRAQVAAAGVTRFITEERFVQKQNRFTWPRNRDLIFVDRELTNLGSGRMRLWCRLLHFCSRARIAKMVGIAAPMPDDEAFLLFTAGTGGKALPVPLTHRMLLANMVQLQSRLAAEQTDNVLSTLPAYTPLGLTMGLLMPLLYGQEVVTYPTPTAAKRLCTLLRQYSIHITATTPAFLRRMLDHAEKDSFAALKLCITTGEKLPADIARDARQRFDLTVCDGYALTETAGLCALNLPNPSATDSPALPGGIPGAVGAPLCGTAIRISDPNRAEQVLPPNTPGLLWVRGSAVMKEYTENSEVTAERRHGAWFCTGDIARMDADGMLTIGGRRTRFSRINGEMVSHDVLEQLLCKVLRPDAAQLKAHPYPLCVVSLPDRTHGERLVLLSTLHQTSHPQVLLTLRYGIMNEGYPAAWTPEQIIPVKDIPLLPDGRLNVPACNELARTLVDKRR